MSDQSHPRGRLVGRYVVHDRIAAGGMATVHLGRLLGAAGFSRTVAIKRLHGSFASDPDFVAMLLDEARLAAQIRHPNVVQTLDVVADKDELLVVMDYVEGDSAAQLARIAGQTGERIPPAFAATIVAQALHGLHAAHEAKDKNGHPLGIVHRDVSPQNILVGIDGIARVLDFGIAKAASRSTATDGGQLKGKVAYMAPEQLQHGALDRRTDVFSAAVVLWELLCGRRLFAADTPGETMSRVLTAPVDPPYRYAPDLSPELSAVVLRGLERDVEARFSSAEEMATAIEEASAPARAKELGAWVARVAAETLASRAEIVKDVERSSHRYEAAAAADPALRRAIDEAEARRAATELPTDVGVASRPSRPPPDARAVREEPTASPVHSTVSPPPPLPTSRTPRLLVVAALLVAAATGAAFVAFALMRGPHGQAAGAPDPSPVLAVAPPPPSVSSTSPSAVVSASSSAPSQATPPPKQKARVLGRPTPTVDPGRCLVPFVVDADGNKHFKEECLK